MNEETLWNETERYGESKGKSRREKGVEKSKQVGERGKRQIWKQVESIKENKSVNKKTLWNETEI